MRSTNKIPSRISRSRRPLTTFTTILLTVCHGFAPLRPLHLSPSLSVSNSDNDRDDAAPTRNYYNDFDDLAPQLTTLDSPPSLGNDLTIRDSTIESLQRQQDKLQKESHKLLSNWCNGFARSHAAFSVNQHLYEQTADTNNKVQFDWARRVSIGQYPRVACGTCYGSIQVADADTHRVLGVAYGLHSCEESTLLDEELRAMLYGEYDGGGVLSVAMYGTSFVASSGREGGVKFTRFVEGEGTLMQVGDTLLGRTVVTTVKFDSCGRLFLGCGDGVLRRISFPLDFFGMGMEAMKALVTNLEIHSPSSGNQQPRSSILSLDVCDELETIATAHANGDVCIYSIHSDDSDDDNHRLLGCWNAPLSSTHARSVTFVSHDHDPRSPAIHWSVVVGRGNGELWIQDINPSFVEADPLNDQLASQLFTKDTIRSIQPDHQGPVVSMASRQGGILVSIAHDGILRVTQVTKGNTSAQTKPLYGLGGYKVWVGNVCIDSEGKRLISDGRDDVIVVHDFSVEALESD